MLILLAVVATASLPQTAREPVVASFQSFNLGLISSDRVGGVGSPLKAWRKQTGLYCIRPGPHDRVSYLRADLVGIYSFSR